MKVKTLNVGTFLTNSINRVDKTTGIGTLALTITAKLSSQSNIYRVHWKSPHVSHQCTVIAGLSFNACFRRLQPIARTINRASFWSLGRARSQTTYAIA